MNAIITTQLSRLQTQQDPAGLSMPSRIQASLVFSVIRSEAPASVGASFTDPRAGRQTAKYLRKHLGFISTSGWVEVL